MQPYLIVFAGGSASGKSSIVDVLKKEYSNDITVIYFDDYYKDLSHLTYELWSVINFDHPDAFDIDLLIEHLHLLKNNQEITKPVYDFTTHNRKKEWEQLKPNKVIILDGILSLAIEEIVSLGDLKVFVDTPSDIRFIRRLERDMLFRGRSLESIKEQYLKTVRPMHELLVEPSKQHADIIIPTGVTNIAAIDLVRLKIDTKTK